MTTELTPPEEYAKAKCSSCGAEILWGVTTDDKRMPLNLPAEKRLIRGRSGKYGVVDAYVSHFATCPQAGKHRRKP